MDGCAMMSGGCLYAHLATAAEMTASHVTVTVPLFSSIAIIIHPVQRIVIQSWEKPDAVGVVVSAEVNVILIMVE